MHPSNQVRTQAVKKVRKGLKVTGLVAAGGKTQDGKAIHVTAKATLALTIISTLLPYAFVCSSRCTNILRARSSPERDFTTEMKHHLEKNNSKIASLCLRASGKGDTAKERLEELRTLLRA